MTMMKLLKSLLLVLVVSTAAQADKGKEPKRCCSSSQYTTKAVQLGARVEYGFGVPTEGYQSVVYDYDAKKLYSETREHDVRTNSTANMKILQDFNTMKQYITLEDNTCYYQEIKTPMAPPCVSENATFMGAGKFGFGSNSMDVLAWEINDGLMITKVAFDAVSCAPIIHTIFGNIYGMDQVVTYYYYDYQPSVTDSAKLVIPTDCKPQPTASPAWRMEL